MEENKRQHGEPSGMCVSCAECQVGQEAVAMPSWSPAHEHFGVVWSVLSSVLLRPFVLVTWWNDRVTDCDPRVRVMTLAVSSPQKNKQPGQLCKSAVSLGSVLALALPPSSSVFILHLFSLYGGADSGWFL